MKKLLLLLTIALCVASYSSPLSAKEDKNTEVTLITDNNDTIICEKTLLDKFSPEKVIEAYQRGKIVYDSVVITKDVIPMKEHTVVYLCLIKEGNRVVTFVSPPITTSKINWLGIIGVSIFFVVVVVFSCFVALRLPSKG